MSKTFDDGVIQIYEAVDMAENGDMPKKEHILFGEYYFGYPEYGVSMNQRFTAESYDHHLDAVVDIDLDRSIRSGMLCRMEGIYYRIMHVQHRKDEEGLWFTRLSLEANDHDPDR